MDDSGLFKIQRNCLIAVGIAIVVVIGALLVLKYLPAPESDDGYDISFVYKDESYSLDTLKDALTDDYTLVTLVKTFHNGTEGKYDAMVYFSSQVTEPEIRFNDTRVIRVLYPRG